MYTREDFLDEINPSGTMQVTIPKGFIIFRARKLTDKSGSCESNHCYETDKDGLYFSDFPLLAMSMALEYKCDMELYVYRLEEEITFDEGKYSHRFINPGRYFFYDIEKAGYSLIPNVNTLPDEVNNHFDNGAISLSDAMQENADRMFERMYENGVLGEMFVSEKDLGKVSYVDCIKIDVDALEDNFLQALESDLMFTYQHTFDKSIVDSIM